MNETRTLRLGVNIDHVATLRQARGTDYPSVADAAEAAIRGGADAITVHLREDRRHIQDSDVFALKSTIGVPLNFEMAATSEMTEIALSLHPAVCCIVPERRAELTTEGGLDVVGNDERLRTTCERLAAAGIEVSLFIDPDAAQVAAAAAVGAPTIELHTGRFAECIDAEARNRELNQLRAAVEQGSGRGLKVNAGHGLHYGNVAEIAALPGVHELNIGHSIVARAVFDGLELAVREMKSRMLAARL